jgi:cytoskeletal protein CcmA (bactofilin family)
MKPGTPEKSAGPATTVGSTVIIRGKLRTDEDLIVEGRIEAEITSTKALIIENSGIVKANVQVKSARVSGVLVGNIIAEEKVELASDGRVVGDILAPKIVIRDGAAFRGRIDMPDFDAPRQSVPEAATVTRPETAVPIVVEEPAPYAAASVEETPAPTPQVESEPPAPPEVPWTPPEETPASPFSMLSTTSTPPPTPDSLFDDSLSTGQNGGTNGPMPPPKPPLPADRDRGILKRRRF